MTKRNSLRALGLSAAIIVGAGGSLAASPAFAAKPAAPTGGPAYEEFSSDLMAKNVAGVGPGGDGKLIVMIDASDSRQKDLAKLDTEYSNVEVIELDGPIRPVSDRDVVGGAGYYSNSSGTADEIASGCSFGFAGWSPTGEESVITAGHCRETAGGTHDHVGVTDPTKDNDGTEVFNPSPLHKGEMFGKFTFSQWGGKSDPYAGEDDPTVTDIAAIAKTNDEYKLKPEVTDWTTQDSGDLSQSTTTITSVRSAEPNMAVKRSGRTTGMTDGTTLTDAKYKFQVADGPDPDGEGPEKPKIRWVTGFAATNEMKPGDSGGPWFTDDGAAVGISSAIASSDQYEHLSFVTDINHGLEQSGGYEVRLHVEAPGEPKVVAGSGASTTAKAGGPAAAPAEYKIEATPGQKIEGSIEKDATIEAVEGTEAPKDLASKDGTYSFSAPEQPGTYTYKLQARKGKFNVSDPITIIVTVKEEPTAEPTQDPTAEPTQDPTAEPTQDPTEEPSEDPTEDPSDDPAERALSIDPENIKATDFVKKDAVTIAASGCTPGTEANLEVKPRGSNVTGHTDTATVDEDGNVGFSVYGENADMPNAYIGDYDVTVSCDGGDDLTGTFTVTEAGGKDDDGKGGDDKKDDNKDLPRTGSEALGSLGAAAALIAGGAGLYVLARRRKN
ncbi:trypsin-like serine protease [Brevibacterium sp. p3-SID960]|uniref:trypsin-like serine protease n=1 Tax=Brevibacterium sp. p3-SID960 TaxID=2916063 RepID=UPI0028834FDA|nr:trypsin-like serine protease [Brevibacterium sp. p3-SID960]